MNRKETLALYAKGKDAWNAWANEMIAKYQVMLQSGKWSADDGLYLEPRNRATRRWLNAAKADFSTEKEPQTFAQKLDFTGFVFPSTALFNFATFEKDVWFASTHFSRRAWFLATQFSGAALFESTAFENDAMFERATFSKNAQFDDASFSAFASFGETTFSEDATFGRATFNGGARFDEAQFEDTADFDNARFSKDASFSKTAFEAFAAFRKSNFSEKAQFNKIKASGDISFEGAKFGSESSFSGEFEGRVEFTDAEFMGSCHFACVFAEGADFGNTTFHDMATFEETGFYGDPDYSSAGFVNSTFEREALFCGTWFNRVVFARANFLDVAYFDDATFEMLADFSAVRCEGGFSLANAHFQVVPNFVQAHFSEAPRLDNIDVRPRFIAAGEWWSWPWRAIVALYKRTMAADQSIPARWRALKRLATQGHDHIREQTFFAMEIRSARFVSDWPLPLAKPRLTERDIEKQRRAAPFHQGIKRIPFVFWRSSSWTGFFRFWAGLFYQLSSDFGRSVARPVALWALVTSVATLYYLGQCPNVETRRIALQRATSSGTAETYTVTAIDAWRAKEPCFDSGSPGAAIRPKTNAADEATYLAVKNGLIVFDGGSDANVRAYSCLYGVDQTVGKATPIVPTAVSFASLLQKLISSVAIFLLGLGLRNMLRLR